MVGGGGLDDSQPMAAAKARRSSNGQKVKRFTMTSFRQNESENISSIGQLRWADHTQPWAKSRAGITQRVSGTPIGSVHPHRKALRRAPGVLLPSPLYSGVRGLELPLTP